MTPRIATSPATAQDAVSPTRKPFTPVIAPEVMASYASQSARFNVALAEQMAIGAAIEGCDGKRGTVKAVARNCDSRLVVTMQEHKGYPATYFAEDVTLAVTA